MSVKVFWKWFLHSLNIVEKDRIGYSYKKKLWNWNIQGSTGGHLEIHLFLVKTKQTTIMIYAFISIDFDPLNSKQSSCLP